VPASFAVAHAIHANYGDWFIYGVELGMKDGSGNGDRVMGMCTEVFENAISFSGYIHVRHIVETIL
jgi:hypothetical protein